MPLDDITRRRIKGQEPDYGLQLDIRGYHIGDTSRVAWEISTVSCTENIDPEDDEQVIEILEKTIEILKQDG